MDSVLLNRVDFRIAGVEQRCTPAHGLVAKAVAQIVDGALERFLTQASGLVTHEVELNGDIVCAEL